MSSEAELMKRARELDESLGIRPCKHQTADVEYHCRMCFQDRVAALLADVQREAFERADRRVYEEGYRDGVARREHQIEVLTAERDGYREHYNKILEMKAEEMLLRMPEPIIIEKPPARALADAPATPPTATTMPPELEALYKLHKEMEIDGLRRQCAELWKCSEALHLWLRRTVGDLATPPAEKESK